MTSREFQIVALAFLTVSAFDAPAFADNRETYSKTETVLCKKVAGSERVRCGGVPAAMPSPSASGLDAITKRIDPAQAFGSTLSLHIANNLATVKNTAKLLKGVTNNEALAAKVAPMLLRLSKSKPSRYGLAIAVIGTGTIAVYQYLLGGGSEAARKPAGRPLESTLSEYELLGEIDQDGRLQESATGSKR